MKNKFIYYAIVMAFFALAACEKDDNEPISLNPEDAPALIKNMEITTVGENYTTESAREFEYDTDNRLVKAYYSSSQNEDTAILEFTYNTDGDLFEIVETQIDYKGKTTYTYSGNMIYEAEASFNGTEYVDYSRTQTKIDENGYAIRQEDEIKDYADGTWSMSGYFDRFTWDNGNLITKKGYKPLYEKSALLKKYGINPSFLKSVKDTVIDYTTTFTYTNKVSPYAYSAQKSAYGNINYSKNLISSISSEDADSIFFYTIDYDYEFGDNGFPSTIIEYFEFQTITTDTTHTSQSTSTTKVEYIDLK